MNQIQDVKSVDSSNFEWLAAQSDYKINSTFRSMNKTEVQPNVPMIQGVETNYANLANPSDRTGGGKFTFTLDKSDYALHDLKDACFNIQAQCALTDANPLVLPRLGNQSLMSLFSDISLFIDGVLVQRVDLPAFAANLNYALRYPHTKEAEKVLEKNGWVSTEPLIKKVGAHTATPGVADNDGNVITAAMLTGAHVHATGKKAGTNDLEIGRLYNGTIAQVAGLYAATPSTCWTDGTNTYFFADITLTGNGQAKTAADIFAAGVAYTSTAIINESAHLSNNESVIINKDNGTYNLIIQQKINLKDIFSVVQTLPPIFNHKITVEMTRLSNNNSYIVCHTGIDDKKFRLHAFNKFVLEQHVYILTDECASWMRNYYSRPIETLYTKEKLLQTSIVSQPTKTSQQSWNIAIDTAYKNQLLAIAIPRSTNLSAQYMSANTTPSDQIGHEYDVMGAPANSYTYGGLRDLKIETTNGVLLYDFDMGREGQIKGKFASTDLKLAYDIKADPDSVLIPNYTDVYDQYVKARAHFGELESEAIPFEMFMKEYCIFCVDLSCFTLTPGENIRITMITEDWADGYNPFHAGNDSTHSYMSSNILCAFYSDKILRLLPDRVEIADMFVNKADDTNMMM